MTHIINNRNAAPAAFGSVFDQLLPKNVTTLLDDAFWGFGSTQASPVAPVNIQETAEGFDLQLAAPGLQKSDFHLKINGDTLTISYTPQEDQRRETAPAESNTAQKQGTAQPRWVRREFTQRAFERHFELADTIDRDKISARYDSGILCLTLPKKENLRPVSRQIDIY
jgi:HSP20 family protein